MLQEKSRKIFALGLLRTKSAPLYWTWSGTFGNFMLIITLFITVARWRNLPQMFFYSSRHSSPQQSVIPYKKNGLITPSEVGNEIFQAAEVYFKSNRFHYRKNHGQIKILTQLISDKIKDDFNPPACCRDKIIRRFVFNRMHFWAAYINRNMKEINDKNISEASHSSKTAQRAAAVPS